MVLKGNEDYPTKSKILDSLWLIRETKIITSGIDVMLNKSAILYHCIRGFIDLIQGETDPSDTIKLRFDNIHETM